MRYGAMCLEMFTRRCGVTVFAAVVMAGAVCMSAGDANGMSGAGRETRAFRLVSPSVQADPPPSGLPEISVGRTAVPRVESVYDPFRLLLPDASPLPEWPASWLISEWARTPPADDGTEKASKIPAIATTGIRARTPPAAATRPLALDRAVNAAELSRLLTRQPPPILVDIRSEAAFARARLPGSLRIPRFGLETKAFLKHRPVVLIDEGVQPQQMGEFCHALAQQGIDARVLCSAG